MMKRYLLLKLVFATYLSAFPMNAELLNNTMLETGVEKNDYVMVDMWGNVIVPEQMEQTKINVWESPEEYKVWAVNSEKWNEIFENVELYPQLMLEDLERNPEILDYVYEYPDASTEASGGLTKEEQEESCPLMIQWDSRWGYVEYGNYNIGISGCGPTSLAMVLYSFTRDDSITPDNLARYAMEKGYYVSGSGTAWSFMKDIPKTYGINVSQEASLNEARMIEILEKNGLLICSMKPGDFTATGHFIVVCGYDGENFIVNDPFSYSNSYKTWDFVTLKEQTKQVWYYWIV